MPAVEINAEQLGNAKWIGQVVGPRGGREIGRNPVIETVDELLDAIRVALGEVGDPAPPMAPLVPTLPPTPAPARMPRHARHEPESAPLVVAAAPQPEPEPRPAPIAKVAPAHPPQLRCRAPLLLLGLRKPRRPRRG